MTAEPYSLFAKTLLLTCLVFPPCVFAAPSIDQITGKVAEGNQVTIAGSGFGTKSPAKPYLWAPMDGSANPSPLGVVTSWTLSQMSYGSSCGPAGGGCLVGAPSDGTNTNAWGASILSSSSFDWNSYGQKTYVYRKSKKTFGFDSSKNVKIIRAWDNPISLPDFYFQIMDGDFGVEGIPTPYEDYTMPLSVRQSAFGAVNKWYTEEFMFKSNSQSGTADGDFRYRVNGGPDLVSFPNTSWMTNTFELKTDSGYTGTGRMRLLFPVHMVVEGSDGWVPEPAGNQYWADDVYVDTTWARVVIADAPVLTDAKDVEIQIPYAWSPTQIGVRINIRDFPPNTPAYLFVVDANGNASPGFPVSSDRPDPPGGLIVN